jgi:hypothetical protein
MNYAHEAMSFDSPMGEAPQARYFAIQLNEAESGFTAVMGPFGTPVAANEAAQGMAMSCGRLGLPRKHAVLISIDGGRLDIETARAVAR